MMRNVVPVAFLLFMTTLAYVIGVRLNEVAMAVVIGVIFGVLASVPATLFLLLALRRTSDVRSAEPRRPETPTIIVAPPVPNPPTPNPWGFPTYLPPLEEADDDTTWSQRRFRVVGED